MTHINYVELPAPQFAQTKQFYASVFGWEWTDYGPVYAGSTNHGIEVGLNPGAPVSRSHAPEAQDSVGPFVLFATDALDEVLALIEPNGGSVLTAPYDFPGGRRFHFTDPSGNVLGVYQYTASE